MSDLITLREPGLVPVIELEPWAFSVEGRPRPCESRIEAPAAWRQYWLDCLADSGLTGLTALRLASWHVPARRLGDQDTLDRIVRILVPQLADEDLARRLEEVLEGTGPVDHVERLARRLAGLPLR